MLELSEREKKYLQALGILSATCAGLFLIRVIATRSWHFWFIIENLALAWLGLVFGWALVRQLKTASWTSWQAQSLTLLWLIFLPNTWYVLTDFVHVRASGEISQLYDITMISLLVFTGFILGFTSLYLVHAEWKRRLSAGASVVIVALVLLLASFAIYLGRDLRWNTWDVITDPSGIILNVSDRILDPLGHPRALNITGLFFILLSSIYLALWRLAPLAGKAKSR